MLTIFTVILGKINKKRHLIIQFLKLNFTFFIIIFLITVGFFKKKTLHCEKINCRHTSF